MNGFYLDLAGAQGNVYRFIDGRPFPMLYLCLAIPLRSIKKNRFSIEIFKCKLQPGWTKIISVLGKGFQ